MRKRALRAISECKHIASMSEEPDRITRRFLTPAMHQVHTHLRARMSTLGMITHVDAAGNLRGLWQPAQATFKRLVLGSHIDTVPNAGAFDGVLGVTLALEWVGVAQDFQLPVAIEVIAFSDEEGVRFGVPFLGSRAVAGRFDPALLSLKDFEGTTVETAMLAFGLDPGRIGEAALSAEAIGFVEIHIEQGPVLEAEGLSVAAVTAIVGQTRFTLAFSGHANHAGTTPMHLRRDALAAAAEWITAVEVLGRRTEGLVATVGKISVDPNAANVVPGSAKVSLDLRNAHDATRAQAVDALLAAAAGIVERRGLSFERTDQLDQPAVPMDERLTSFMADAIESAGLPAKTLTSGAGHDAMVMAARVPTTMLFLRSPGGLSHHPAETVLGKDVEVSLEVAREFLMRVANDLR
jgi:allantoate deiminase